MKLLLSVLTIFFIYAGFFRTFEQGMNPAIDNFGDAFYYAVVSLTTVGFGDITPVTRAGRWVTVATILAGIVLIPWEASRIVRAWNSGDKIDVTCPNYELTGHDPDASHCKYCGHVIYQEFESVILPFIIKHLSRTYKRGAVTDWIEQYEATADLNEKYGLIRNEMARLRGTRERVKSYDYEEVAATIRDLSVRVDGQLIAFVANDFGYPAAYRPAGVEKSTQDEIRRAILANKYDATNDDLNDIRRELLETHPAIHKAIVAEYDDGTIRYHLPEGSNPTTNFLTVREMVGLIDYTTNSAQSEGMSRTY